jgi:hypothetical protein
MHVSRKEDKGGNTVQLRFDNKGTNLHSLWDSKLIDHERLSQEEIVKTYDTATPSEIIPLPVARTVFYLLLLPSQDSRQVIY